jgi:hypothetical protein
MVLCRTLGASLLLFAGLAACADDGDTAALTNGDKVPGRSSSDIVDGDEDTKNADGTPTRSGPLAGMTAKEIFTTKVHPELTKTCAGCHTTGPAPAWIAKDAEATYALMFQRGYVTKASVLITKGAHNGGAGPALTSAQLTSVAGWVDQELRERGDKAPPSVLARLASCMDQAKFDAIGFGTLQTVTRTAKNNPTGQTEDANTCTGCKPSPCATCHSADPGSGFLMAVGNDILEKNHTFEESKSTNPPYLQKYFGLDTSGTPIPSKAIRAKSDLTVQGKAYSHPMFVLSEKMETAIGAFVLDAITKYKAGTCGQ